MYVHRSNRMEALVDVLADVVAQPLARATAAECIAVQGRGMERWLSMDLARRLGVWANPDFPFPRRLIERAMRAVPGTDDTAAARFAPEVLMWSIAAVLPQRLDDPEFAPIRTYLAGDRRGMRRLELAERIARTFDHYAVYRPEMVLAWERGREAHWQAVLWRDLIQRHGSHHVAARAQELLRILRQGSAALDDVPQRISIFGISTLPPLYLEILTALARHVEVHLFLLSPSREYWAAIRSRREQLRVLAREPAGLATSAPALHLEEGHPLLASLGRIGRDFQQVLESTTDYEEPDQDLHVDPGTATMLTALQSDILALRQRTHRGPEGPLRLDPDDTSIRIHACHSPMREVEVLHDQLLALLDADPTLEPRDVVVMSPAIDAYAPYVDAVFGASEQHTQIPYRIADRAVRATDGVIAAFLALLGALRGRLTANQVLDLLGLAAVRERFGLVAEELDLVRRWVREAGIRWGADAQHRAATGQPELVENTWRFGLDRLLLGYAMPGGKRRLFCGVLPYDDLEGAETELLGRLAEFCDRLFAFHRDLQAPRTLEAWRHDLGRLLGAMVASTRETAHQHRDIQLALDELAEHSRLGAFNEAVELDSMEAQLAVALERGAPGRAFLTGGVTFCALVPMRSIPFRVVCLLGMNDADFPRAQRPFGFDLSAQRPRAGDRSARDDDRYLFLEAVLSARQTLIVTYVGRSIRDHSEIPPSVVVNELLDALEQSFIPADAQPSLADAIRTCHPLQGFSPRYFCAGGDPHLFSYAHQNVAGARALSGALIALPPFLPGPLPPDVAAPGGASVRMVTLDQLVRFFEKPTRAFLQSRLGLYLGRDVERLEEREPLELDALERWQLGSELLERAVDGEAPPSSWSAMRASGALPPGVLGQCLFEDVTHQVTALAASARDLTSGRELEPLAVDVELDGTRIVGVIRDLWARGQVRYQFSKLGRRHELGLWIRHLGLNCVRRSGCPQSTYLVGRAPQDSGSATIRFRPVADAESVLRMLLQLYWIGQNEPLLLFEQASRAYAERVAAGWTESRALGEARRCFSGGGLYRGCDLDDDYVRQVFGGLDPLQPGFRFDSASAPETTPAPNGAPPSFADVALRVYAPLLSHREEMA